MTATATLSPCGADCAFDCPGACSGCNEHRPDEVGLSVEDEEHGFCSLACFVTFVRRRWMEAGS